MKNTGKFIILLLLSIYFTPVVGQELQLSPVREKAQVFSQQSARVMPGTGYHITSPLPFTSVSVQIREEVQFAGAYLIIAKDSFFLAPDEDVVLTNGFINARLVSLPEPVQDIYFYTGTIEGEVLFNFINSSAVGIIAQPFQRSETEECLQAPASIGQQTWRAGLTPPDYARSFSTVQHVIIHHSAGSNTNTNYTQVVRDIYIYHTEVNGWSDIGYNYLIAQDGTIFAGRDPDGGAQDDVRGAHFCGMNTGTMGICLLGNYTDVAPPDAAIQSLLQLISWKLDKESLNAFETFDFNDIRDLGVIAGHRDGCSTECPGSRTYEKIFKYKQQVNALIEACYPEALVADFTWTNPEIIAGESVSFTDASQGPATSWQWFFTGAKVERSSVKNPADVVYPTEGEYDVTLVVRNGAITDTAYVRSLVKVAPNPFSEPAAYPNPVLSNMPLYLSLDKTKVDKVSMVSMYGREIVSLSPMANQFWVDISGFNAGIYFIRFFSAGQVVKSERIMIAN